MAASPIITSIFSYLILNEQFTSKKIIAMIVTLVGVSLFSL
jgi:drug/metabolite transporter (DMT)-like permease